MYQVRLFIHGSFYHVRLDERSAAWYLSLAADEAQRLRRLATLLEETARQLDSASGREAASAADCAEWEILVRLLDGLAPATAAATAPNSAGLAVPPPDGVWSIENAIHYINLHFSQAFSVDFFVDKCALNAGDFSRRFKQLAGCPLFEYINRQRVRRACVLLKSSSASILQIADQVGYNNLSFFNRYFLRIMGCSPREYRNRSG